MGMHAFEGGAAARRGGGGRGGGQGVAYQVETFHNDTRLLGITDDLRHDALLAFVFSSQYCDVVAAQNMPLVSWKHGLERFSHDPHDAAASTLAACCRERIFAGFATRAAIASYCCMRWFWSSEQCCCWLQTAVDVHKKCKSLTC